MTSSESIYNFLNNPVRVTTGLNLFVIFISTPILLFTVMGYYFSWHAISSSEMPFITIFLLLWLGLLAAGYFGCKTWKVYGRVASFLAWLPMLFMFPIGTVAAAWIIYSIFRRPVND